MPDPRLDPPLSSPTYAVRAPLASWLEREARRAYADLGPFRLLDVGCGERPYEPFFAPYAATYTGVDAVENPRADLRGAIEALPVRDASYDLVLCAQVLEHCDDPVRAVAELCRVTTPGGRVLASTHGVMAYHPSPADYWRWTVAGLERLFATASGWAHVRVEPASGTTACIGMIASMYLALGARRARLGPAARPFVHVINRAARAADRRSGTLRDARQPGALIANFHVVAERA
jgi:SAM-dependent methyltransferase